MIRRYRLLFVVLFLIPGCVASRDFNIVGLHNVARISGQQKEINRYCKIQGEGFRRLMVDIARGDISSGTYWETIRDKYGDPVATIPFQSDHPEMLVYRRPCDLFALPIVYLNFDREGELVSWSVLEI